MKLTKEEVQKRVLKDGKPLDLELFNWNEESRTFESEIDGLVIDFKDMDSVKFNTKNDCMFNTGADCVFNTLRDCTFKTGDDCVFDTSGSCTFITGNGCDFTTYSSCTFKTGNGCKFNTGSFCTFDTGSYCSFETENNCTFDTGPNCTFDTCIKCVFVVHHSCKFQLEYDCCIINKKSNEVIKPEYSIKLTTCPENTPGYLIGSDYYVNGVKQDGEYMIVDDMLFKIISKKDNVYNVNNFNTYDQKFDNNVTYIVQDGDIFARGSTIEEANKSLIYRKICDNNTTDYDNLTLETMLTKKEAIKMYRIITGSCEYSVRNYISTLPDIKDKYSVKEIIELTNGQYGNDVLRDFFKI